MYVHVNVVGRFYTMLYILCHVIYLLSLKGHVCSYKMLGISGGGGGGESGRVAREDDG